MKAIITTKYRPHEVIKIRDVDNPSPKGNEALIKVK